MIHSKRLYFSPCGNVIFSFLLVSLIPVNTKYFLYYCILKTIKPKFCTELKLTKVEWPEKVDAGMIICLDIDLTKFPWIMEFVIHTVASVQRSCHFQVRPSSILFYQEVDNFLLYPYIEYFKNVYNIYTNSLWQGSVKDRLTQ